MTTKRIGRYGLAGSLPMLGLLLVVALCVVCAAQTAPAVAAPAPDALLDVKSPLSETVSSAYLPLVVDTQIRAQPEWSAAWWQWIEAVGEGVLFEQGEIDCSREQSGDIWHLAGTAGGPPVTRSCTISDGKVLFMPILTVAWSNEGDEDLTIEEKRTVLAEVFSVTEAGPLNTKLCGLSSEVDGTPVPDVPRLSPPFLRLGDPESVSDGYFFAFKPPAGEHEVVFSGTLCDFSTGDPVFEVDVTYNLTVE